MSYGKGEEHSFYCLNCGLKGIPLMRPNSRKREKFHRKKLYCPHCKMETQHVETTNNHEAAEFKELFSQGAFIEENRESLEYLRQNRSIWLSQILLCNEEINHNERKFKMNNYSNCVVYKITNLINNKSYIGSTNDYGRRMREHRAAMNCHPEHPNYYHPLYSAFRKYGLENFSFEILVENVAGLDNIRKIEKEYIKTYNSLAPNGYNLREDTRGLSELDIQRLVEKTGIKCALVNEKEQIVKTYNSLREAERDNRCQASEIAKVCKGEIYSTKQLLFRYLTNQGEIVAIPKFQSLKSKEYLICGISAENPKDIKYYSSVEKAAKDNGISKTVIFQCLKGESRFSICNNRIWRKVEDGIIIENNLPISQVIEQFNQKYILHKGERKTLAAWCKYYGIHYDAVRYQVKTKKRDFEEVLQEFLKAKESD